MCSLGLLELVCSNSPPPPPGACFLRMFTIFFNRCSLFCACWYWNYSELLIDVLRTLAVT